VGTNVVMNSNNNNNNNNNSDSHGLINNFRMLHQVVIERHHLRSSHKDHDCTPDGNKSEQHKSGAASSGRDKTFWRLSVKRLEINSRQDRQMITPTLLSSRAEKLASVQLPTKRCILGPSNKGGSDEGRKSLARRFDSSVGERRTAGTVQRGAAAIHRQLRRAKSSRKTYRTVMSRRGALFLLTLSLHCGPQSAFMVQPHTTVRTSAPAQTHRPVGAAADSRFFPRSTSIQFSPSTRDSATFSTAMLKA
jgi:hypothetical protein